MKREFERRLARSEFHEIECNLKILSEEGFAVLNINHGEVSVSMDNIKTDYQLDIPLAFLNPLITGYKDISELSTTSDVKVRGGELATRLIEVLFPVGFPSGGMLPVVWD
jgi:predicted acetyltransferase